jgi:hypothetical protein
VQLYSMPSSANSLYAYIDATSLFLSPNKKNDRHSILWRTEYNAEHFLPEYQLVSLLLLCSVFCKLLLCLKEPIDCHLYKMKKVTRVLLFYKKPRHMDGWWINHCTSLGLSYTSVPRNGFTVKNSAVATFH